MNDWTLLKKSGIGGSWSIVERGTHQRLRGYVTRKKRRHNGDTDIMYQRIPSDRVDEFLAAPEQFNYSTV